MTKRVVAGVLALVMVVATGATSVARAEAAARMVPLSASEAEAATGEGWLACVGAVAIAAGIVASGGTAALGVGALAAALLALGYSIVTVCACGEYIDDAVGTDFTSKCETMLAAE